MPLARPSGSVRPTNANVVTATALKSRGSYPVAPLTFRVSGWLEHRVVFTSAASGSTYCEFGAPATLERDAIGRYRSLRSFCSIRGRSQEKPAVVDGPLRGPRYDVY
jgi:hypothetical protein